MIILSIDTSADETSCAITAGRRVLSNVVFSQIVLHEKWGGIFPTVAKRAHEERIDGVIETCLKKARMTMDDISAVAVTQGPGLAIALEVGIRKAKELTKQYSKKLIAVNHLEGHIYSAFVQNKNGNPKRDISYPLLALVVSGGHTELVLLKDHLDYEVIGKTIDDAAGEALDKAGKLLGLGYPAGPVIERLSEEVSHREFFRFPRPMIQSNDLRFSFSGLKTSLYYFLQKKTEQEIVKQLREIASSYQEAVFETIVAKTGYAITQTGTNRVVAGGGVMANQRLRFLLRKMVRLYHGSIIFPPYSYLSGDNAVMIGIVAYYKAKKNLFVENIEELDRMPRMSL